MGWRFWNKTLQAAAIHFTILQHVYIHIQLNCCLESEDSYLIEDRDGGIKGFFCFSKLPLKPATVIVSDHAFDFMEMSSDRKG